MAGQKQVVETLLLPFPERKPDCQPESGARGEEEVGIWFGDSLTIWDGGLNEINGVLNIRLGLHRPWGGVDLGLNGCTAHAAHGPL